MKVGDFVRYKCWWGGHIGRCVRIYVEEKEWSTTYEFYWFLDGSIEHEDPDQLTIIPIPTTPLPPEQELLTKTIYNGE